MDRPVWNPIVPSGPGPQQQQQLPLRATLARDKSKICSLFFTAGICSVVNCPFAHYSAGTVLPLPSAMCRFHNQAAGMTCKRDHCRFFHGTAEQFEALRAEGATSYRPAWFLEVKDPLAIKVGDEVSNVSPGNWQQVLRSVPKPAASPVPLAVSLPISGGPQEASLPPNGASISPLPQPIPSASPPLVFSQPRILQQPSIVTPPQLVVMLPTSTGSALPQPPAPQIQLVPSTNAPGPYALPPPPPPGVFSPPGSLGFQQQSLGPGVVPTSYFYR